MEGDYGYRFAAWTGDVDTVADVSASQTTFTMPEGNVTIDAEYLLIGDANLDGNLTLEDSLYIAQMAVDSRTSVPGGDMDNDGVIGTQDVIYIDWYLVGTWKPTK